MKYIIFESQFKKLIQEEFVNRPFVKLFELTFNTMMKSQFDWFIDSKVSSIYHKTSQRFYDVVVPYMDIIVDKEKSDDTAKNNISEFPDIITNVNGYTLDTESDKYIEIKNTILSALKSVSIVDEKRTTGVEINHISVFFH